MSLQAIKDAIASKKMICPKCAQDVLDTRKKLVEAYYGHGEYAGQGGLSVFLPGRELRDTQKEARGKNPAGRMALMTEPGKFAEVNKDATSRNAMLSKLETQLREVRPRTLIFLSTGVQGVEKETKAIEDAASAFTKAGTDEDRKKAFDVLHKAAENMEKVDHFDKLRRKTAVELRVNSAQEYSSQLVGNGKSGWSRFRVELRDGTR